MSATQIGIAIVERDGRVLVGTRSVGQVLDGFAEFPGGKLEDGESVAQCVVRECREEAGLHVVACRELDRTEFEYPHGTVELHFWQCEISPEDRPREPLGNFQWLTRAELARQRFPPANAAVLNKLLAVE